MAPLPLALIGYLVWVGIEKASSNGIIFIKNAKSFNTNATCLLEMWESIFVNFIHSLKKFQRFKLSRKGCLFTSTPIGVVPMVNTSVTSALVKGTGVINVRCNMGRWGIPSYFRMYCSNVLWSKMKSIMMIKKNGLLCFLMSENATHYKKG